MLLYLRMILYVQRKQVLFHCVHHVGHSVSQCWMDKSNTGSREDVCVFIVATVIEREARGV